MRAGGSDVDIELHTVWAVSISRVLYGNDMMSSFVLEKGVTKSIIDSTVQPILVKVVNAQA